MMEVARNLKGNIELDNSITIQEINEIVHIDCDCFLGNVGAVPPFLRQILYITAHLIVNTRHLAKSVLGPQAV